MKTSPSQVLLLLLMLLTAVGAGARAARGQNIYLRDGQMVTAQALRRSGDTVLARVEVQGGQGEIGYAVANIARIDFPEPAQIKAASDALNAGHTEEAARQLAPVLAYYAPFRDLPGNWWSPLALLQVDALMRLDRDREADALVNDLIRSGAVDPDTVRTAKIKQSAALERKGDHHRALDTLAPILKDATVSMGSLAEAWVISGSAHLALREYKDALMAYLHVPLYSPDRTLLMPPALLGSAGAYVGLGDDAGAQTVLNQLVNSYPGTPEAAQARERLKKLAARSPKPAGT